MSEGQWTIGQDTAPRPVNIKVNGQTQGQARSNERLGDVVERFARSAGIKTANVYADGQRLDLSSADQVLDGIGELDIVAKDSRGQ